MKPDEATQRQIDAADPRASTWLSANAGSGKTRVLTDRVARLLLGGVSPQNILCLTYTKAAANEMQNRLFLRLGKWSMKDDAELRKELNKLGVTDVGDEQKLAQARTLFARAIETPGGLRIQTIHSFCASLLRRFPLEAGVSPIFREIDDRSAKLLRRDIVEEIARGTNAQVVRGVAQHYAGEDFDQLTAEIIRHREDFPAQFSQEEVWSRFGLPQGYSESDLTNDILQGGDAEKLTQIVAALNESTKSTDLTAARKLSVVDLTGAGKASWDNLFSVFLTGAKAKIPFGAKVGKFPTKDVRNNHPELADWADGFMERVELGRTLRNSLYSALKTLALYEFATVFLPEYEKRKAQSGWLDFDDLIFRAKLLLTDPDVAQWVLFRLDGSLDHILVDEAQDTSPEQWQVVELLTQEFGAGTGARSDDDRTIFVVGDKKQSIYSFQGADPLAFDKMRQHFSNNLGAVDQQLYERSLDHSFRSSFAILDLVDHTFGAIGGDSFTQSRHQAFHSEMPGRVDLWPVIPKSDDPDQKEWFDPTDKLAANDHRIVLAETIAEQISQMVQSGSIPDENGGFRQIQFGDFLILVQRRSVLFHEIIRVCKSRGLPIAGADRLKIGAELAVKDLTALLSFLVTPDDDLSLASALRSPLFGMSEAELFDLAHYRHEPNLWPALVRRHEEYSKIFETLSSLRNQVDFLSPFEILERALTRHNGRRRLLARLGDEAEDGIDAMLSQAIEYEHSETPSLTGFLAWLEVDSVEIKRQPESAGNRIRVMTTHGAKGLEAPIVILPDTGDIRARQTNEVVMMPDGLPIWKPNSGLQPNAVKEALAQEKSNQTEERLRLLYVAMTRAEKWLIVCASGTIKDGGESWYRRVEAGMLSSGAQSHKHSYGDGLRLQFGEWIAVVGHDTPERTTKKTELPAWATTTSIPAPDLPPAISPSNLGGAKVLSGETELSTELTGALRGTLVHRLLEHLPVYNENDWPDIAGQLLDVNKYSLTETDVFDLLSEAKKVLKNPSLEFLFDSRSLAEVNVTAQLPVLGNQRISGTIDHLIVETDRILIVDFKSNQFVPTSPKETPEGILRQMCAYLSAIELVYPNRKIEVAILWTRTANLMMLPHDIVRSALTETTTS